MTLPETLLLPGLGSPESPLYQEVYQVLTNEARRRDMLARCIKYKGHGHLADGSIEGQIDLPGVARGVAEEVSRAKADSLLICRSFGCLLPGYLVLEHGLKPEKFKRIAFWGAVPYYQFWNLFGTRARLAEKSAEAEAKGARLAPDFFQSIVPQEISCERLLGTEIVFAVGTRDRYTTPAIAEMFASIVRAAGNPNVAVRVVDGAPHEITDAHDESVKVAYLDALFG